MKQTLRTILLLAVVAIAGFAAIVGCTGRDAQQSKDGGNDAQQNNASGTQPGDTVYTQQAAMAVFGYDPVRALQIVDSAVIVGNLSAVRADVERARIYSMTQMRARMDSLLGGVGGASLDTARSIGERLLAHDSRKNDELRHKNKCLIREIESRHRVIDIAVRHGVSRAVLM